MALVKADHHHGSSTIIGKLYCEASEVVLIVRKRPLVVNGGGFVVTNCSQSVVFRADGGGRGAREDLVLRDSNGDALLLVRRMRGIVRAMSIYKKWKGYTYDYQGSQKLVFNLKEPNHSSCLLRKIGIRISSEPRRRNKVWDFEIRGCFPDRVCTIVDHSGNTIAQIGVKKELMVSKDIYHVVVKPGIDQAFVFGIIAVLDCIYGESARF